MPRLLAALLVAPLLGVTSMLAYPSLSELVPDQVVWASSLAAMAIPGMATALLAATFREKLLALPASALLVAVGAALAHPYTGSDASILAVLIYTTLAASAGWSAGMLWLLARRTLKDERHHGS